MKKETLARKVKATVESGIRQRKKVVLFEHLILMVHSVKLCLGVSYMKLSAASLNLSEFKLGGSVGKESACNAGDPSLIPGLGRSPGEGDGNLLQYSCLENPMDRGAWQVTACRVSKSRTSRSQVTLFS